tara:strand:+ start:11381 stop:11530 length:150 start_codon:yes stop_codon:yes gene_type:complete
MTKAQKYFIKLNRQSTQYNNRNHEKGRRQFLRVVGFSFEEINAINNKQV